MRVAGLDGTTFALVPLRYEFPDHHPQGAADHDANWLDIQGQVEQPGVGAWSFVSACLTTWDCQSLVLWLADVATGALDPVNFAGVPDFGDPGLLYFDEPTVAFSLAAKDEAQAAVWVHLSLEALPPHLAEYEAVDIFEYFVVVTATLGAWADAAKELTQESAAFPAR